MDESNYDLIDLHKNVVDEITLVSHQENQWARLIWLMFGLILVQCLMHNGIILWKQKNRQIKDFQLILLQKVSIKHVVGFILYAIGL
jgi:hypothetical protein